MKNPLNLTQEEKERIRKQHEELEKQNKIQKDNIKKGVSFKKKTDE